jgi:serine/threonine-protein kinase RsbW
MTPVLVRQWTLDHVHELRVLRAGLRNEITGAELSDRVTVVATELATNALRHGEPPAIVRLFTQPGRLLLDVSDQDVSGVPRFDLKPRPAGTSGGLGLLVVRTFAEESGWYQDGVGDGLAGGAGAAKHVWASFHLP